MSGEGGRHDGPPDDPTRAVGSASAGVNETRYLGESTAQGVRRGSETVPSSGGVVGESVGFVGGVGRRPMSTLDEEEALKTWMYGGLREWPSAVERRVRSMRRAMGVSGKMAAGVGEDDVEEILQGCSENEVRNDILDYRPPTGWVKPGDQGLWTHYDRQRTGIFYDQSPVSVSPRNVNNDCRVRHWIFLNDGAPSAPSPPEASVTALQAQKSSASELGGRIRVVKTANLTPSARSMCSYASGQPEIWFHDRDMYVVVEGSSVWPHVVQKLKAEETSRVGEFCTV